MRSRGWQGDERQSPLAAWRIRPTPGDAAAAARRGLRRSGQPGARHCRLCRQLRSGRAGIDLLSGGAGRGQPAYDPRDLLKLSLYGDMNRIRSGRRLEQECQRNIELIWLLTPATHETTPSTTPVATEPSPRPGVEEPDTAACEQVSADTKVPASAQTVYVADSGYCTNPDIATCEAQGVPIYISVPEKGNRAKSEGRFPGSDFHYDAEGDSYRCLNDCELSPQGQPTLKNGSRRQAYVSRREDCDGCPLRQSEDCDGCPLRQSALRQSATSTVLASEA
ncbi:MAG: hypothetical protein N838_07275 [Thiohalocapsa sp. PB-PSB1]|nr:MAG: hypothetical protein N838_07275 [Thiohalocapsa sp. PB-PSB1]